LRQFDKSTRKTFDEAKLSFDNSVRLEPLSKERLVTELVSDFGPIEKTFAGITAVDSFIDEITV
jgi:hypothetical protein